MTSLSARARAFADQAQRPSRTPHSSRQLIAAEDYARRGWPVFPVTVNKIPLTAHGRSDATLDPAVITEWWSRWMDALASIATGAESGIVALDIDVTDTVNGWDSLDTIGVSFAPETPMAHTPRGGTHCLFEHPGHFVKTIAGKLGPGLDIRGDGGSLILPPGPGRFWDPVYALDYPLAPMPDWMVIPEPKPARTSDPRARSEIRLSRYGEAALDDAVKRITSAPAGEQEPTLAAEVYGIARLAGGGAIPPGLALDALLWAASKMPAHDPHRPWRPADLDRKVRLKFTAGLARPRAVVT